jgi:hypothetical protein
MTKSIPNDDLRRGIAAVENEEVARNQAIEHEVSA